MSEENIVNDKPQPGNKLLAKLRNWIIGITGILVVLPSLIIAGIEVREAILQIPQSESERVNKELYQKYFGKKPIFEGSVPVRMTEGTIDINLEVHDKGDIFIRYGQRSQWFKSPLATNSASRINVISNAYAFNASQYSVPDNAQRLDINKPGIIQREYYLPEGNKKIYSIDPVTGFWSTPKIETYEKLPNKVYPKQNIYQYPAIDLTSPLINR